MTKRIDMEPEDARQVRSILMTHSEMQDQRINSLVRNRALSSSDDKAEIDEEIKSLEADSDNLKRIASLF